MAPSSTARRTLIQGIAEEFLHHSRSGRRLIAVAGAEADTERVSRFADDLAAVLGDHGQPVARVSVGDADEDTLRRETIDPFRAGSLAGAGSTGDDTVLVADGRNLLDDGARGIWHFSLWLLAGDELPHSGASVIVDATDESAPTRYFYDLCKLPPSVNRPGLH